MIVQLNLPLPSQLLSDAITRSALSAPINPDNKRWSDQFHNNKINSALQLFGYVDNSVVQQIITEYQNFFSKHQIIPYINIMQNNIDEPACIPPHSDRGRKLAINCYIHLGGDQVETVFYKNKVATKENSATNFLYANTGGIERKEIFSIGWYAYEVNRIHSVENIETTRIMFAINFAGHETSYNLEQLIKDYPDLINKI